MARTPIIDNPEEPQHRLTQLQAKRQPGAPHVGIKLDLDASGNLEFLKEFYTNTCGINPSPSVIIRYALSLVSESLQTEVRQADVKRLQGIIRRERRCLVKAAGRSRDQEYNKVYDALRGHRKGDY